MISRTAESEISCAYPRRGAVPEVAAPDECGTGPRRGGVERALGLAGQVLNAGTNVATSYVASLLLVPDDFGRFVIAFGCVTVVLGAGRGLLGATMLVHLPGCDADERNELVGSAVGFAALTGVAASMVLVAGGFWAPVLWWFAPWVVVALLQDVGRYVCLATDRRGQALVLDAVWAVVQVTAVVIAALVHGSITIGLIATAWGVGAFGGMVTFVVLARVRPTGPSRWTRATRDVAGWFTATAVAGQLELYLVLLLAGLLLSAADVGGLRAVQLVTLQPALVLIGSMLTVLQPAVVRASATRGALRRVWPRITLAVSPVIGWLALVVVLRDPLVAIFFPQYVADAFLIVPVALQGCAVALGVAPLAVLNGLRYGASAFTAQACRLVGAGVAVVVGSLVAGLGGVAWALVLVALLSWLQIRAVARRAIRRHEAGAAAEPAVVEGAAQGAR